VRVRNSLARFFFTDRGSLPSRFGPARAQLGQVRVARAQAVCEGRASRPRGTRPVGGCRAVPSSEDSTPCTPQLFVQGAVLGWGLNGKNSHHRPVQLHGHRHESAGPFGIRSANRRLVRTHLRAEHSTSCWVDLDGAEAGTSSCVTRSPFGGRGACLFFGLRAAASGAAFAPALHALALQACSPSSDVTCGPYSGRPTAAEAARNSHIHMSASSARLEQNPKRL